MKLNNLMDATKSEQQKTLPLLHNAAANGDENEIDKLLNLKVDPNEMDSQLGWTALSKAVSCQHLGVVRLLVGKTNSEQVDLQDETPLHIAARKANIDIVQELLKHGYSPNIATSKGITPLLYAVERNNEPIIKLFLTYLTKPVQATDALLLADKMQQKNIIKIILSYYLQQMLNNPMLFHSHSLLLTLSKYHMKLWYLLKGINQSSRANMFFLKEIIASCHKTDARLHHPLYTIFSSKNTLTKIDIMSEIDKLLSKQNKLAQESFFSIKKHYPRALHSRWADCYAKLREDHRNIESLDLATTYINITY